MSNTEILYKIIDVYIDKYMYIYFTPCLFEIIRNSFY